MLSKFKTDYEIWAKFSLNFVLFKLLEAFATFALFDEEKLSIGLAFKIGERLGFRRK
ncbi:MAG: hypothetical protein ACFNTA_09645 [Campylobacter sp.]|uniref:hypothetical protein n=1 Tax=Campylobacter sp. TaxID=205 RepID=UPI003621164A